MQFECSIMNELIVKRIIWINGRIASRNAQKKVRIYIRRISGRFESDNYKTHEAHGATVQLKCMNGNTFKRIVSI